MAIWTSLPHRTVTAESFGTTASAPRSISTADVDSDGDLDVVYASYGGDIVAWLENDGNERFTAHTISTITQLAVSVFAVDMDNDGDVDVLSASQGDHKIA